MKKYWMVFLGCCIQSAFAWNDVGHKLAAQIAWDHMTEEARVVYTRYNDAMQVVYPPLNFVQAATWLDNIRYRNIKWYNKFHYIDIPFSVDETPIIAIESVNAVSAIQNAIHTLAGKHATDFDKGFAFRVLLHVVADIHQPLHATTRVSAEFPKGDVGGNLFVIRSPIANNLHAYWDKGGGVFTLRDKSLIKIKKKAKLLVETYGCDMQSLDLKFESWIKESHDLGVNKAYNLPFGSKPDRRYEEETQLISEQRIVMAGCRLAALLNAYT